MHVGSDVYTVVPYLQEVSASVGLIALRDDLSVTDGIHRSPRGSRIVHPVVGTVAAQYRVEPAVREARGDAVEVQRSLQERPLQAVARGTVIQLFAVLYEGDGVIHTVRVAERGRQDVEVVQLLALHAFLFVDHPELVLLLQAEEVDGPSVDVRKLHGEQGRGVQFLHGHPQRRFHLASDFLPLPFHGVFSSVYPALVAQVEHDVRFRVLLVDEEAYLPRAVLPAEYGVRLPVAHLPHIEHPFRFLVQFVDGFRRYPVVAQDDGEVLSRLDDAVIDVIPVYGDAVFADYFLYFHRVRHFHLVQRIVHARFRPEDEQQGNHPDDYGCPYAYFLVFE